LGNGVLDDSLQKSIVRTKTGLEKQRTDRESISGVIPGFDEMDAAR
jgi:hypothetical protein